MIHMDALRSMRLGKLTRRAALAIAVSLAVAGCSEQITKHGHIFHDSDLLQVQNGMTQDQVRMVMGTPTTTTTSGTGNVYYYISSTTAQTAFFKPAEKDRQVAAVYFDPNGGVERVANYGLKDGKIFDFITATTPAPGGKDDGLLKQLFRNLGQKQMFGDG